MEIGDTRIITRICPRCGNAIIPHYEKLLGATYEVSCCKCGYSNRSCETKMATVDSLGISRHHPDGMSQHYEKGEYPMTDIKCKDFKCVCLNENEKCNAEYSENPNACTMDCRIHSNCSYCVAEVRNRCKKYGERYVVK